MTPDNSPPNDAELAERERSAWSGAIEGWRKHDRALTALGAPVSEELIRQAEIGPGDHVLDLACGTGDPALRIAEQVGPSGSVLAIDFAEPLVAFAREKAAARGLRNVEFRCEDAEEVRLVAASFAAVTSRWGIMFMAHPQEVMARACAALRPGGRSAVATWGPPQANPFIALPFTALRNHIEIPAPAPDAPGVFAFADATRVASLMERAGFHDVRLTPFAFDIEIFDHGAQLWQFTREIAAPLARLYGSLHTAQQEAVDREVAAAAERFRRGSRLVVPAQTWIATGVRP